MQKKDYELFLEKSALREFKGLPREAIDRISDAIDGLVSTPRPNGSKKLTGKNGYRIRIGDYRVLYTVDDTYRIVRIYRIGHRREIYRG